MNCNTQKGLLFIIIGSIITMICSLIISISSFFTQNTPILMISISIGMLSFIGLIIILVGEILFLIGRKEFGEKHQKNVINAVIIFVILFVVMIIFSSIISVMVLSAVSSGNNISISSSIFPFISMCVVIISAILGSLIYYFALIELENETGKTILYSGIIISIIISIVTSFYLIGMLSEIFGSISINSGNYFSIVFSQNIGKISILGIIPRILFLFSFYIPYKRINDGELVPISTSISQTPIQNKLCRNCGRFIPFDAVLCPYCGLEIQDYTSHSGKSIFCKKCGFENKPIFNFCKNCRNKL